MNVETLFCTCGRPVRVVRLNAETMGLGHTTNPGLASHPVRLAPAARSEHGALPEGSDTRREDASGADPSHPRTTTKGKRASSNGIGSDRTSRVPRRPSETSAAT